MAITLARPALLSEDLPDADYLEWKAASNEPVIIYQPYLGAEQRTAVHELAIPFDISFNSDADTREYELFKTLHAHHRAMGLAEDAFWGLLSSKYDLKSASSFRAFLDGARDAKAQGADCYLYNPLIGCASIYANVQEHARLGGHPGMEAIFQYLGTLGCPVAAPQGTDTFFFCNYFCGNEAFWSGYFGFCDLILHKLDEQAAANTPAGTAYRGSGNYSRDRNAMMRPFVIERLLGYYVHHATARGLKVVAYAPTADDFEWKFGRRMGDMLHRLYSLKQAMIEDGDAAAARAWAEARLPLVKAPHLIWQMDDPPGWMPRSA